MAQLIYSTICSLDGYVADAQGGFEWAAPDEEVHAFANGLERGVGTHLFGRRMYETMLAWEHADDFVGDSVVMQEYADLWQQTDKVVYSTTLASVSSARTRLEREFDPASVRDLKAAADRDLSIGGPHLAAQAIRAGLVDEWHVFVTPIVVGGGTRALPDDAHVPLVLLDEHRFAGGVVHLRYGTRR